MCSMYSANRLSLYSAIRPNLLFHVLEGGHRSPADVVMPSAPAHGRPVSDLDRRADELLSSTFLLARPEQLPQRLHAVEEPLPSRCRHSNALAVRIQHVTLRIERLICAEPPGFQGSSQAAVVAHTPQINHAGRLRQRARGCDGDLPPHGCLDLFGQHLRRDAVFSRARCPQHNAHSWPSAESAFAPLDLFRLGHELELLRQSRE